MNNMKLTAAQRLAPIIGMEADDILPLLVRPPKPEMGDIGFPCFSLARERKMAPPRIAAEIADVIVPGEPFSEIKCVGPYVNFSISLSAIAANTVGMILADPASCGCSESGRGRTMVIDYSSPNVAKPLAIHHLRTNVIGGALLRMYRATGWNTVAVNHLGDWGTTFGQLMAAYKRRQDQENDGPVDVDQLFNLYVKFHADADEEDSLDDEARAWFKKLEDGDAEATRLWRIFVDAGMKPLHEIYQRLGLTFDHFLGESFFNDKMDAVIRRLRQMDILRNSQGAEVVDLEEYGMPPCIIRKSDGATTYATRDLAAAEYRQREFKFDKCLYVVANQQELHFRQVFKVLELMGYSWAGSCEHVKFGMLSLGAGVLGTDDSGKAVTGSTRKGRVVFLAEVLDRAVAKARDIIIEHAREDEVRRNIDELADQVGVGAVVFSEYMQRRTKDIVFTWNKALNLQGDSGPYLQYTHARLSSLIRRYDDDLPAVVPWERLTSPIEREVMLKLGDFTEAIEQAVRENEPSLVAGYLLELCAVFNRMFTDKENHRIVSEDRDLTSARMGLVTAMRITLARGLELLGLAAPERM